MSSSFAASLILTHLSSVNSSRTDDGIRYCFPIWTNGIFLYLIHRYTATGEIPNRAASCFGLSISSMAGLLLIRVVLQREAAAVGANRGI